MPSDARFTLGDIDPSCRLTIIRTDKRSFRLTDRLMCIAQISVDIIGSNLSRCNRFDYCRGTRHAVASRIDVLHSLNQTSLVSDKAISLRRHSKRFKRSAFDILSNSDENDIAVQENRRISVIQRSRAPCLIRADHLRAHPEAAAVAVLIFFNSIRSHQRHHFDAFHSSAFDFRVESRHIILSSAVNDGYFIRLSSDCSSRTVHSDISAADNDDFLSGIVWNLPFSDAAQHVYCRENTLCVTAVDPKFFTGLGPDRHIDRIKLPADFFHGNIFSDFAVQLDVDRAC